MLALLVIIRDVLLVAALAWVGISIEPRERAGASCASESCQQQRD
jgi:hypothetical protein